jgi:hypothetical protein
MMLLREDTHMEPSQHLTYKKLSVYTQTHPHTILSATCRECEGFELRKEAMPSADKMNALKNGPTYVAHIITLLTNPARLQQQHTHKTCFSIDKLCGQRHHTQTYSLAAKSKGMNCSQKSLQKRMKAQVTTFAHLEQAWCEPVRDLHEHLWQRRGSSAQPEEWQ